MEGTQKKIIQFKTMTLTEWEHDYPIPQVDNAGNELQSSLSRKKYIPIMGEVCGVIIQNETERKRAKPVIPDAYEHQAEDYMLLKMGTGTMDFWDLPWTNIINNEIVKTIVNNIFLESSDKQEGFIQVINNLFAENVSDWNQNNPEAHNYIKNRICSAEYQDLPLSQQTIIKDLVVPVELTFPEHNIYTGNIEFETKNLPNLVLNEMDKYEIEMYNDKTGKKYNYSETLYLLQSFNQNSIPILVYGLGNTNLLANYFNSEIDENFTLPIIDSTAPYGMLIVVYGNELNNFNEGIVYISCEENFLLNPQEENKKIKFTILHTQECTKIKPISERWLPDSIKAPSDWNVNSFLEKGYIKNRICEVISYENDEEIYFSNEPLILTPLVSNLYSSQKFIINNFGNISSLNKYRLRVGDKFITTSFTSLQSFETNEIENNIYLLGNNYIYVKYLYDSALLQGKIDESIKNLIQSTFDDGTDFCCVCSQVDEDLLFYVYYRFESETMSNQTLFGLNTVGLLVQNNDNSSLIQFNYNIKDYIENNSNFIIDNENYYLVLNYSSNQAKVYKITEWQMNDEEKQYNLYFDSNNRINLPNNSTINDIFILHAKGKSTLGLRLDEIPLQVKTIDPLWLPEQIKVGRYEDNEAQYISAEIFNDYIDNHAFGAYSHAEGLGTIANGNHQHVQGRYNLPTSLDNNSIAFMVGNGNSDLQRSNAYTLDFEGNSEQSGINKAVDFVTNQHRLSSKENSSNKVKHIKSNDNEEAFPTSQAVIEYFNSILPMSYDKEGNIILNFTSIDGNGLYGNPFIDK